jgi:uncharacterized protein (UPF0548 family)
VLFFRKPSIAAINDYLAVQGKQPFSYTEVGGTRTGPPAGFVVDRTRFKLGSGEATFLAAKKALTRWEQFHLSWMEICFPETPIEPGRCVAILARVPGMWSLNACRIIYVEDDAVRFGYAYGTLPDHAARGEERFRVEWDRSDDAVWFDIVAFSRPSQILTKLGYPFMRRQQRRFGRDASAAMQRVINGTNPRDA